MPVVTTARPADTGTQTSDRSLSVVDQVVTEVWTVRNKTQAELHAATTVNSTTIHAQAATALTNNTTHLAIGTPTNKWVRRPVRSPSK